MAGELWEIVRADELKVGDVAYYRDGDAPMEIEYIRPGPTTLLYRCVNSNNTFWEDNDAIVFRRHTGHHPDVLMRVIENMHSEIRGWNEVGDYPSPTDSIDKYIAEAESEIAKERES